MNVDIERLNMNVGGKPVAGYAGDRAIIDRVESQAGAALPHSYLSFLQSADGGCPEIGSFGPPGGAPDNLFDVDVFFSLADARLPALQDAIRDWSATLGPATLPIGRDGGGNPIYIDMSHRSDSVWIFLHDEDNKKIKVADTFESFIAMLRPNPDFV